METLINVELTRKELNDLCLALLAAEGMSNDGGNKWETLREKLKSYKENE